MVPNNNRLQTCRKLFEIFPNELNVHSCVDSYISAAEVCCILVVIMAWVVRKSINNWRRLIHHDNYVDV